MIDFPYKSVLLDIDGTLLDSNAAHSRAWRDILQRHGYGVDEDRVRPLIGKGGDKLLEELVGLDSEAGEGKTLSSERKALFKDRYLPYLSPTPGARELLLELRARGIRLIVATSAGRDELDGLLARAGLADLIADAANSTDTAHSKPDPDIVAAALAKGGVSPNEAVMLGDTPYDIEAARRCGVDSIALRCGGFWDDIELGGAVQIYDSPADLLNHLHPQGACAPNSTVAHPVNS